MNENDTLKLPLSLLGSEREVDETAAGRFALYARLLLEWNEKMNLTAITEPEQIVIRHFADSLTLLRACEIPVGASVIDVGTGAGFPGVPLKIVREDIDLTLLDSLNKRLNFLSAVSDALALPMRLVHARAEEGGKNPALREQFDVACARAVAALPVLCEYCLPFVKRGGCFVAMKGPDCAAEIDAAKKAIHILGGTIEAVEELKLADGSGRTLITVCKTAHTPPQYPRHGAKIAKAPL